MVPETDEQIVAAMRAKLAALDARLITDAADLDDEGRGLVEALRRAADELGRALDAADEGNER